jgi:NitT/TauT family transport system ATP-binding protein
MLEIHDLAVRYGSSSGTITAVENLTLSVADGEFVVILGPSGCGKSTLLKVVSGLIAPSQGRVVLDGRAISGPRSDVGIVFQSATLLPWKTVLENVLVPIRTLHLPIGEYRGKAVEQLKTVGLGNFLNHYPRELSGGMQQRVGIARGLIHDPKMLLMDEPFAALDAMTREFMTFELQRVWLETKKSLLFITHSIPEAVFLADRVVTLSHRPGRMVDELKIDLPRPRGIGTMSHPRFAEACTHLRELFETRSSIG